MPSQTKERIVVKTVFKTVVLMVVVLAIAVLGYLGICIATGNTMPLSFVQGLASGKGVASSAISAATGTESGNAFEVAAEKLGLSAGEVQEATEIASSLGVDVNDAEQVNEIVTKNLDKADEVQSIVAQAQSGQISQAEAKAKIASLLDLG